MRTSIILATLFGMASIGCDERPLTTEAVVAAPTGAVTAAVSAARPVSLPRVSLIVTVSDDDPTGVAYGIQSDGLGTYTDGSQNVEAVLDQSGTFAFNTNTSRKAATRWVRYNFNNPVDPSNTYRPTPSNTQNYHFSTGPSAFSPFTALQNLGVNGNASSECMYMGNGISNGTTDWRVSFHKGNEDVSGSPTAFSVATRTSVSPAVWTITPVGSCSPIANIASLRSGDGSVLYGYYTVPFYFTLRAK